MNHFRKGNFNFIVFVGIVLGLSLMMGMIISSCSALRDGGAVIKSVDQLNIVPTIDQVGAGQLPAEIAPIKAPFKMPQLRKPTFADYSLDIRSLGAKEGAKVTAKIQKCIDVTSERGGGKVIIPKGKWYTGRISLKSNVNLHLEAGAELTFSGDVADYRPAVFTRNEGVEVMSLGACIYANGQENIAITGKGKLIGPAKGGSVRKQVMESDVIENFVDLDQPVRKRVYEGYNGSPIFLPMFISPINCKEVFIEGITLENTAFWNIVPVYCDGVIIRGITVNSVGIPRGDGIDVESSRNVLIEYSTLSCGDDCFTIKAGRGLDGLRVNKPSENIVVRYCLAREGHGGVTVGSETAGMIRNLSVQDCVFDNTGIGIRFKTRRPRGGGGEHLYYQRIRMRLNGTAFKWDMLGSPTYVGDLAKRLPARPVTKRTPVFRNISARNIIVESSSQFIGITGIPESPLKNVRIENAQIKSDKLFKASDVDGLTVRNVQIESMDSVLSLLGAKNILFDNVSFQGTGRKLEVKFPGGHPGDLIFKNCQPAQFWRVAPQH
ncbi:MAG TPA: glycoside hydrolase family 28 protein [Arachidicoccus sp.]|nr:glycoside hydrolase family 28 protein [Arachidicoccus sp.]